MSKESPIEAFIRINQPRAKKARDHIANIRNSGKSLRISRKDVEVLLAENDLLPSPQVETYKPVQDPAEYEQRLKESDFASTPSPHVNSAQRPPNTQWVERKREQLVGLPTTDLIDIALACAVEIANRRT